MSCTSFAAPAVFFAATAASVVAPFLASTAAAVSSSAFAFASASALAFAAAASASAFAAAAFVSARRVWRDRR